MPNRPVFLDTSGWLALLSAVDEFHAPATAVWEDLLTRRVSIVLTDWIVAETGNGLARSPERGRFRGAVKTLRMSPSADLVPITDDLLDRALDLYSYRPDKAWGLVDCTSFVLMQERGIQEALTVDRHFEQAGFRALLRDQPLS